MLLSLLTPCLLSRGGRVSLLSLAHTNFSASRLCPELPPSYHLAGSYLPQIPTRAPTFLGGFHKRCQLSLSDFSHCMIMYILFSTWLNNYFSIDHYLHCVG
jgi:hypothetical protein